MNGKAVYYSPVFAGSVLTNMLSRPNISWTNLHFATSISATLANGGLRQRLALLFLNICVQHCSNRSMRYLTCKICMFRVIHLGAFPSNFHALFLSQFQAEIPPGFTTDYDYM